MVWSSNNSNNDRSTEFIVEALTRNLQKFALKEYSVVPFHRIFKSCPNIRTLSSDFSYVVVERQRSQIISNTYDAYRIRSHQFVLYPTTCFMRPRIFRIKFLYCIMHRRTLSECTVDVRPDSAALDYRYRSVGPLFGQVERFNIDPYVLNNSIFYTLIICIQ